MGPSYLIFGAVSVLGALALVVLAGTPRMRAKILPTLAKSSGLAMPSTGADVLIEREVRRTRTVFVGSALGTALATASATLMPSGQWETGRVVTVFLGFVVGTLCGVWIDLIRVAQARSAETGRAARPDGAPLRSFVGIPLIVATFLFAAMVVLKLAHVGYLINSYGFSVGPYSSTTSLVISIVSLSFMAVAGPATLALGVVLSRRRQSAASNELLAWGDAQFTQHLWAALFVIGILVTDGTLAVGGVARDLVPAGEEFRADAYTSTMLDVWLMLAALGVLGATFAFRPWRHYLKALWPTVERARQELRTAHRSEKRAAYLVRRAAERRAYHGLPPE